MDRKLSRAVILVQQIALNSERPVRIVAIDGLGGAGKSTFAALLAPTLAAQVIHTDDFASADKPLEWWPRLRDEVLIPLRRGEPARFQRYDWRHRILREWKEVRPTGTIILEGVSSSRKEFRSYLDVSIWIETRREVRLKRGLDRDGEDALSQWREWMAQEDAWVATERPRQGADLVLSGEE